MYVTRGWHNFGGDTIHHITLLQAWVDNWFITSNTGHRYLTADTCHMHDYKCDTPRAHASIFSFVIQHNVLFAFSQLHVHVLVA